MEFLPGMDLQKLISKYGPLSVPRMVFIITQVAGALAEAHHHGIVHRDIKPSNIFLTVAGDLYDFVKVLDFGLAREYSLGEDLGVTQAQSFLGTPRYAAPELIHHKTAPDPRTDIYQLGALCCYMVTGHPPFEGGDSLEILFHHLKDPPRRPSELSKTPLPPELDDLVLRCMQKEPADRYANIDEFLTDLQRIPLEYPWTQARAKAWWEPHLEEIHTVPTVEAPDDIHLGEYEPARFHH
jgi:serine/threonine-protein kinase